MSITVKMGSKDLKITAGSGGALFLYQEQQGFEVSGKLTAVEAMDLVAYLTQMLPTFSSPTYNAVVDDVDAYKRTTIREQKISELMQDMCTLYFRRGLNRLTNNEAALVRRAAVAEIAVAEAEGSQREAPRDLSK